MAWSDITRKQYSREGLRYPTDLSAGEYAVIEPYLPQNRATGRKRLYALWDVVNAVFYLTRTGCQWRMLPKDFPPWQTVYGYYRRWLTDGTWALLHDALHAQCRLKEGRKAQPTAAILDSQTVKTTESGGISGYDGAKKIKGRKRHIVVDTMGLLLACHVHAASGQDRDCGGNVLARAQAKFSSLAHVWADGGYRGERFFYAFHAIARWSLEIVQRSEAKHFAVLPKRWIVERTFAWINRNRRLAKDFEKNTQHSEAYCTIAMIALMLRRITRSF